MPAHLLNATCTAGSPDQAFTPPIQLSLVFSRGLTGHTGDCFSGFA